MRMSDLLPWRWFVRRSTYNVVVNNLRAEEANTAAAEGSVEEMKRRNVELVEEARYNMLALTEKQKLCDEQARGILRMRSEFAEERKHLESVGKERAAHFAAECQAEVAKRMTLEDELSALKVELSARRLPTNPIELRSAFSISDAFTLAQKKGLARKEATALQAKLFEGSPPQIPDVMQFDPVVPDNKAELDAGAPLLDCLSPVEGGGYCRRCKHRLAPHGHRTCDWCRLIICLHQANTKVPVAKGRTDGRKVVDLPDGGTAVAEPLFDAEIGDMVPPKTDERDGGTPRPRSAQEEE